MTENSNIWRDGAGCDDNNSTMRSASGETKQILRILIRGRCERTGSKQPRRETGAWYVATK
jgi:hypothetical protein